MSQATLSRCSYRFNDLRQLMAKASPARSGDYLAEVPLKTLLQQLLVPDEQDEVTRLIIDSHDAVAFAPISHLTVGIFVTGCWASRRSSAV